MRRPLTFLALFLAFLFAPTAHADSFQYTIVWGFPHVASFDSSSFLGTYTFTVDTFIDGEAFVYGPGFSEPEYPYPYLYAADFTVPPASRVSQIMVSYFPDYTPYNNLGIPYLYGFDLYQKDGAVVATSLLPDPNNPNRYFGDYGDHTGSISSLEITRIPTSAPTPEPSTITLLGTGALGIGTLVRRRLTGRI